VDSVAQIALTRALIDIESTTGREPAAGSFLARTLRDLGYDVTEQPVVDGRFNVFASFADPVVVLSTHFDTVPPFFPSRVEGDRLHGRGACDAKGALVAMVAAAERLRAAGEKRIGLLFVVGEERGSEGARVANTMPPGSRFLIDGEPTDNRLGTATRGVYRARIRATGRAAHSSQPELGESAIDKLIDALILLRGVEWPEDAAMGRTFYTVGLIDGGVAPNVISPSASAELMFRTVGSHADLRQRILDTIGHLVGVEDTAVVTPVILHTVPGIPSASFAFTTDIPFLDRWGAPLLLGPGSVRLAHTAEESVGIDELTHAVDLYVHLCRQLLDA
jgi:acetylornithine deacetylase